METISFSPAKLDRLRDAYKQAVTNSQEIFDFEGHELVTGYAKYLIEYLTVQFKERGKQSA